MISIDYKILIKFKFLWHLLSLQTVLNLYSVKHVPVYTECHWLIEYQSTEMIESNDQMVTDATDSLDLFCISDLWRLSNTLIIYQDFIICYS